MGNDICDRLSFRLNTRSNAVVVFLDGAEIATYFRDEKEMAFHSRCLEISSDPPKEFTEPIVRELVARGFISIFPRGVLAGSHISRLVDKDDKDQVGADALKLIAMKGLIKAGGE